MKKINFKSVVKGIVMSPVYAAGFVYGIGKHIVNRKPNIESDIINEFTDDVNDVVEHIENSSPFAAVAMNGAVTAALAATDSQLQESVDSARNLDALMQEGGAL